MIRILSTAVLLALAAPFHAPVQANVSLSDVERALSATRSMTADFQQQAGGRVDHGTMLMKRPGRVRFEFRDNVNQLVVADGTRLSFVDYRVAQVSQWPLRETPLGVLLDPRADLSRIARVLPADAAPGPGIVAVEAQDPRRPDIGRITFFLAQDRAAPGGLRLTGWRVIDAQNNLTTVSLSNIRTNIDVADSSFRFRDPRPRQRVPGRSG